MFKTDVDYRNYFFFFEKSNMHGLLGTYTDYVNLRFSHIHDYLGSTIIRDSRVINYFFFQFWRLLVPGEHVLSVTANGYENSEPVQIFVRRDQTVYHKVILNRQR